ncbi:hypothetical protein [Marivivens marinus]|uniref:hypothetical protein n=1 Tax=Marivivens marinus TaxID=3110173 RepID=UPI003B846687
MATYRRRYTEMEVRGMLQIYGGNRMMTGVGPGGRTQRSPAPAHASIHGGASFLDQRTRVNTPGEPRTTGTYWTFDDQVSATTEILNSMQGQIALQRLEIGEKDCVMEAALPHRKYKISSAHDDSDKGGGAGHLGRNNAGRMGAGSTHTQGYAVRGFVKAVAGINGTLQIQTSFPIAG